MAKFTLSFKEVEKAVDASLFEGVLILVDKIVEITPRDPKRPPKDPSQRVYGDLKRSMGYKKISNDHYVVGVKGSRIPFKGNEIKRPKKGRATPPNVYGSFLEFGTIKMKPRSFIRKGLYDNQDKINKRINSIFKQQLRGL